MILFFIYNNLVLFLVKHVIELVSSYEAYLKEDHPDDLYLFSEWLKQRMAEERAYLTNDKFVDEAGVNAMTGYLLGGIASYLDIWVKLTFSDTPLTSLYDFGIIKAVQRYRNPTKKKIASEIITDYSSCIEMIKRLVKNGYLTEKEDEKDKRTKLVRLTKKGKDLIKVIDIKMKHLSDLIAGDLPETDKISLIHICKKLNLFHEQLYRTKNKETIKTLYNL